MQLTNAAYATRIFLIFILNKLSLVVPPRSCTSSSTEVERRLRRSLPRRLGVHRHLRLLAARQAGEEAHLQEEPQEGQGMSKKEGLVHR